MSRHDGTTRPLPAPPCPPRHAVPAAPLTPPKGHALRRTRKLGVLRDPLLARRVPLLPDGTSRGPALTRFLLAVALLALVLPAAARGRTTAACPVSSGTTAACPAFGAVAASPADDPPGSGASTSPHDGPTHAHDAPAAPDGVASATTGPAGAPPDTASADFAGESPAPAPAASAPSPARLYGAWVLVPPVVTILLAIVWRQVIPALTIGILVAAYMLAAVPPDATWADRLLGGVTLAVEGLLLGALTDADHMKIIVFTLVIGAMVGVIGANGGTPAIVAHVARWASNRRRGQLATWAAGLLVFFDDYANAMIVGPSMRPVCDRLRISRAKLAYIVDSTAAPVASIAILGTWIGAEIGYIDEGLRGLAAPPAFLAGQTAYGVFLASIPYRYYAILALVMVLIVAWLNRDFGPMRHAEQEAAEAARAAQDASAAPHAKAGRAWYAGAPILVLLLGTLGLLVLTGWQAVQEADPRLGGLALLREIVTSGDSYNSILYGALAALLAAVAISLATRSLTLARTMDSGTHSMARMLPTILVLTLAWALSASMQQLELGEVARGLLREARLPAAWLPLLVFVAAGGTSFATGTSWGTMGILCPAVVTIAAGLVADLPAADAAPIFYAAVGAVLAGAVFGDHCSPISDTTVLSSLASECSLEAHVWTQMPYALVVAGVSIVSGDILCRLTPVPAWLGLVIGSALLLTIVRFAGRPPVVGVSARPAGGD